MANKNPEAIENDFKGLERLQNGETEEITKATAITHNVTAPKGLGFRHLQVVLLFCGLAIAFGLRVNLSVGIVAMTSNDTNAGEVLNWDDATQGLILSSFFWGYFISQVPASQLALIFGAKALLVVAGVLCAILTLFTPWIASWGWQWLTAVRALLGFVQGVFFPCTHTILAKWAPPSERGRMASITYSGVQLGTVIMLGVSGQIASSFMGWPGIFYCSGVVCIIWTIALYLWCANTPADCANITQEEKLYIESMPGSNKGTLPIPWKAIMTSKAFISLIIVHCANNWGFWTLLTEIPSYLKQVFGFDIKTNALLTAFPYLVMWLLIIVFSTLSDQLINKNYMSVSIARKVFTSIGHWVPMVSLIGLAYTTNTALAIFLLAIAVGMSAGTNVGFLINHIDLSPNFAGTLMAITNSIANILSLLAPLTAGYILNRKHDDENDVMTNWRTVFFVAAGFYLCGNLIFVLFGRGKIQFWNEPKLDKSPKGLSTNTLKTVDINQK